MQDYAKNNPSVYDDLEYADVPLNPFVQDAILKSDYGPHVAHALSKDLNLANKLNKLDPIDAMREIVKIEEQAKVKPSTSSAPPPVDDPKSQAPQNKRNINDLTMEEYMATMNKLI